MRLSLILCVVFSGLCHYGIDAALTTVPQSDAVITGNSVQLNCAADNDSASASFHWHFNALNSVPVRIVYNCQVNPDLADKYQVIQENDGECHLVILNTNMASAGTYSCQNGFDQASATIVMLNSNSMCSAIPATDLVSGEFIRIQCVLNFNGSITPRMLWFDNSTGFPINNDTTNTFPTQINSFINVPVYPPTVRPYMSYTYFDPPITYTYRWILPTVYVQFPVTKVLATARIKYFEETSLVCSAEGFPTPTYEWTNLDTGATFEGSTISIPTGRSRYECQASNVIRGETETITTTIATDITEGVPDYCPTTPAPSTTTTEPTTTTTTTTEPTTTTEFIGECGRVLHTVLPEDALAPDGWSLLCYISRNDTDLLSTMCRNLIIDLPTDSGSIVDYVQLLQRGGNFGCSLSSRQDYVQATFACNENYQQTITMNICPTCPRMFVCIKLPPASH